MTIAEGKIALLFGLNGLSLSLLTLPIMYILNTRVEVPLPYLPAYGAIAFLPYSLKPLYAYLCGLLLTVSSSSSSSSGRYLGLFSALLTANGLCTAGFCAIPNGGVVVLFVVAFARGVTDSWAEFCLGLTLIDHARELSSSGNNNGNGGAFSYDTAVSKLQSQAATAGNLGAWLASVVTFLLFVQRYFGSDGREGGHESQLSGGVANALILATASVQLLGACAVRLSRPVFGSGFGSGNRSGVYREIPTGTAIQQQRPTVGGDSLALTGIVTAAISDNCPTELDSLRGDEESSHPSYSSLEDLGDDEDSLTSTSTTGNDSVRPSTSTSPPGHRFSPSTVFRWVLVVLLQCVLVLIALKGPIVESSSHFVWSVSVTTLAFGILLALLALWCGNGTHDGDGDSNSKTLRVGLYLVLRNAVPSDATILASFVYSLLGESQPLTMQLLAVLGMGVSSLSSWSYTRLFSTRFGGGRPLLWLMGGTIVLASLASLVNIAVVRAYWHSKEDEEVEGGDGDAGPMSTRLLLVVVVSKIVTTFFEEWAFLPELVLATTSVSLPMTPAASSGNNGGGPTAERALLTRANSQELELGPMPAVSASPRETRDENLHRSNDNYNHNDKRIAMEYGTLVACIDFGDQLGSLAAAPLVAILNISRDNDFLHLDRLILVCAVANMVVTIGLLPLLVERKSNKR
eukprot:jgi/Psemu1/320675/estExt_fgenesh1_pm.C_7190001